MSHTRAARPEGMLASREWVVECVSKTVVAKLEFQSRMLTAGFNVALKENAKAERKWVEDQADIWADAIVGHLYEYIEQQRLHRRVGRKIVGWWLQVRTLHLTRHLTRPRP